MSARAFDSPAFRRYQLGRFAMVLGLQGVGVAVGWQVYALTGRALDLGLVGLVHFLPQLLLFPLSGAAADHLPRHRLLVATAVLNTLGATLLAVSSGQGVGTIFALVALMAVARAFAAPLGPSMIPLLVEPPALVNAFSWNSAAFSVSAVLGPALAGGVWALSGSATTSFGVSAGLLASAALAFAGVRPVRELPRQEEAPSLASALVGLRFIFSRPVLLAAISLDLFAVLFGGAVALLPIYAADILHAGPAGLGLLRAAPSAGAVAMALWLTRHPIRRRVGPTLLAAVAVFGLATLAFAGSTSTPVAALALVVVGAADEISVFIRQNVVQLSTPEQLRGRVSAAEFVFIGASNELGELESGLAAAALGPVGAAALGGFGSLLVVAVVAVAAPRLRRLDHYGELEVG